MSDEDHKTDCGVVISEVYLYLDLECSDERRNLIQKHLDDCSDCLREYGIEHEVKALVARCCGDEVAPVELRQRLRAKLSELVLAVTDAEDRFASAEDLSDDDLEKLHEELRARADAAREALDSRRASKSKKAS